VLLGRVLREPFDGTNAEMCGRLQIELGCVPESSLPRLRANIAKANRPRKGPPAPFCAPEGRVRLLPWLGRVVCFIVNVFLVLRHEQMPDPRQEGESKPRVVKRKPDRRMKISLLENVVMRGSVGEPSSSYDVNECEKANGPSETREMPLLLTVAPCCQE